MRFGPPAASTAFGMRFRPLLSNAIKAAYELST
jgi:hypothetical protein